MNRSTPERASAKPSEVRVLMSRNDDGRFVSFFGDLHPSFFGNVVKAMGGAKQGYPDREPRAAARRARERADAMKRSPRSSTASCAPRCTR